MRRVCVVEAVGGITDVVGHRTAAYAAGAVSLQQGVALAVNRHAVLAIRVAQQDKSTRAGSAGSVPDGLGRAELGAEGRLALLALAIVVEVGQALDAEP